MNDVMYNDNNKQTFW